MTDRPLLIEAVVRDGDVHVTAHDYATQRKRAAERWGDGCHLRIRIEPEEDAYTYGQLKFYWGQVVTPLSDETGYHKQEAHQLLKVACLPEGKSSLTELNREELQAYIAAAEQTAREWCPDAFLLYEDRS